MSDNLNIGDPVMVIDEGLEKLRSITGETNHFGTVSEIQDDGETILVEFPIGDDSIEDHSQVAPYPTNKVQKR